MQQLPSWLRQRVVLIALPLIALGLVLLGYQLWSAKAQTPAPSQDFALDSPDEAASDSAPADAATPQPTSKPAAPEIVVYISGAVHAPDVYRLPADARVKDVVIAAGGLTAQADLAQINLAQRLKDEQHVHVPLVGETERQPVADGTAGADASADGLLDLNTASADDLEAINGVGKAMAARIIDYRTQNGPFGSVEDLRKIKGIGAATYDKIAPQVTVRP